MSIEWMSTAKTLFHVAKAVVEAASEVLTNETQTTKRNITASNVENKPVTLKEGMTLTENGAVTYETSGSQCLDLFGTIGAMRNLSDEEITQRFDDAFAEAPTMALRILFYARDIREGLGERRVFRIILKHLAETHPDAVIKNLDYVSEFGRYDDLLVLLRTPCEDAVVQAIKTQLQHDMDESAKSISLLAKWLPSINTSSRKTMSDAVYLSKKLGVLPVQYRKMLTKLRQRLNLLENAMRSKTYTFDYQKVPSQALLRHRKAFIRNDAERYKDFLHRVSTGEATMHTGTLMPYDIIEPLLINIHQKQPEAEERRAMDTTWRALPDYTHGTNAIAVVDGSGSMYWDHTPAPISVALSLGLYFAERNHGPFQNKFITFSQTPQLVTVTGSDIAERVLNAAKYNEVANTNLEAVFQLLLNQAKQAHATPHELPEMIYIISDMEFDACVTNSESTNIDNARRMFAEAGYDLPSVVFWNVNSRNRQQPVRMHATGTILISGSSLHIFDMIANGALTPVAFMNHVLQSPRYAKIQYKRAER